MSDELKRYVAQTGFVSANGDQFEINMIQARQWAEEGELKRRLEAEEERQYGPKWIRELIQHGVVDEIRTFESYAEMEIVVIASKDNITHEFRYPILKKLNTTDVQTDIINKFNQ